MPSEKVIVMRWLQGVIGVQLQVVGRREILASKYGLACIWREEAKITCRFSV